MTSAIRSSSRRSPAAAAAACGSSGHPTSFRSCSGRRCVKPRRRSATATSTRSEEHTSELQSPCNLVCRPPTAPLPPYTTLFRSSDGPVENEEKALKVANDIGYPVIIKAVAGGGGRGMRIVRAPDELPQLFRTAMREAEAAFGNGDVYKIGRAHV